MHIGNYIFGRYFNPLRHTGGDIYVRNVLFLSRHFNPLRHTGGDGVVFSRICSCGNFNPLRHTGGDDPVMEGVTNAVISIHSATQAETLPVHRIQDLFCISIHSATQAETMWASLVIRFRRFQSTPPHRRRRIKPLILFVKRYFNPLRHTGGDIWIFPSCRRNWISIHSATQAETICGFQIRIPHQNFNPLRHTGGDCISGYICLSFNISIHSATQAETPGCYTRQPYIAFQSTPPHRRRLRPFCL